MHAIGGITGIIGTVTAGQVLPRTAMNPRLKNGPQTSKLETILASKAISARLSRI